MPPFGYILSEQNAEAFQDQQCGAAANNTLNSVLLHYCGEYNPLGADESHQTRF